MQYSDQIYSMVGQLIHWETLWSVKMVEWGTKSPIPVCDMCHQAVMAQRANKCQSLVAHYLEGECLGFTDSQTVMATGPSRISPSVLYN